MAQETSGLKIDDERDEAAGIDTEDDQSLAVTSNVDDGLADDLSLLADDDASDDTEQIRERIEETRSSMGETIDAIQERLSMANISEQVSEQVNNAIETAKDTVYEATLGKAVEFMKYTGESISRSSMGRSIAANPWPYALIGLGSAWLVYSNMSSRKRYNGSGSQAGQRNYLSAGDRQGGRITAVTETASGMLSGASEKLSSTASTAYGTVASTASDTYNKATDVVNRAYGKVGEYGHTAQETYEHYVEEKPLAVAAAAAAVGAVIGFAIPSTNYEGKLIGETRDSVMSTVGETANQFMDKAKEVAGEAGRTLKEEIGAATENTGTSSGGTGNGRQNAQGSSSTGRTGGGSAI